ncbi:hypothetical protein LTR22_023010 [Elasticomyces elasticus]|nr:hypothetical protein LTR22_023010 [Elasticomyces elasticus]KAK5749081.1 hypothetical protein LTS12_020843 [Elasticomyces elasticus]
MKNGDDTSSLPPTSDSYAVSALTNAVNATLKVQGAVRTFTEQRDKLIRRPLQNASDITALDHDVRAQIDEVFLVLALLGETLLPLRVFDNTYYPQTLADVEASIQSGGHELMPMAFRELSAELQYAVTSGLAFCSCFAPMPVYRGFGAAVLNDWDWGSPDLELMMKKMKTRISVWVRMVSEKQDPQPNRAVLESFDHVIQLLQVKQVAFLSVRPSVSGFAAEQPRYHARREKEVRREINVQEDWSSKIGKLGHPSPPGFKISTYSMPYATWTSPFSCQLLSAKDAFETIMTNQMDPGRLLHAFVCRQNLDIGDGQLLVLPARSPAESLACWLEGLPGFTHKIVRWSDLDTDVFTKKCGKSLRNHLGQYPLPDKFVMRDPSAPAVHRPSIPSLLGSPTSDGALSPPPYSPNRPLAIMDKPAEMHTGAPAAVELETSRAPVELDSGPVPTSPPKAPAPATTAQSPTRLIHHAASTSALMASRNMSYSVSEGVSALRSLTGVRRKSAATPSPRLPSVLVPGAPEVPPKIPERPEKSNGDSETPPPLPARPVSVFKHEPMMSMHNVPIPMPDGPVIPQSPLRMVHPHTVPSVVITMPDEPGHHSHVRAATMPAELSAEMPSPIELPTAADSPTSAPETPSPSFSKVAEPSKPLATRAVSRKEVPRRVEESGKSDSSGADDKAAGAQEDLHEDIDRLLKSSAPSSDPPDIVKSEQPPSDTADDAGKQASTPGEKQETAAQAAGITVPPSSDTYLDLLNKVASGEISPQALQQLLQSTGAASPAPTIST